MLFYVIRVIYQRYQVLEAATVSRAVDDAGVVLGSRRCCESNHLGAALRCVEAQGFEIFESWT